MAQISQGLDKCLYLGNIDSKRDWGHARDYVKGDRQGVDASNASRVLVRINPRYFRPTEVDLILGDPTKAKTELGWEAEITFEALVKDIMTADLTMVKREAVDY